MGHCLLPKAQLSTGGEALLISAAVFLPREPIDLGQIDGGGACYVPYCPGAAENTEAW